jgi:nucleotide-binding universal stress UspA family protein
MSDIITGVDGSEASHRALRWALEQARLRGDAVVVVSAYRRTAVRVPHTPVDPYLPVEAMQAASDYRRSLQDEQDARDQRRAEQLIEQALHAVGGAGDVVVKPLTAAGDPGRILVERSEQADMLVVGSRGRGGVKGLVLGSVSQHCVHHARCPVVVVR